MEDFAMAKVWLITLTVSNPSKAKTYRDSGFQMFWAGITK